MTHLNRGTFKPHDVHSKRKKLSKGTTKVRKNKPIGDSITLAIEKKDETEPVCFDIKSRKPK